MIRFGIVGHRNFDDKRVIDFMTRQYLTILKDAQTKNKNVTAVSAIAEGADTLFAEVALSLKIPLEIVRPFKKYAIDFETKDVLTCYEKLRSCAVCEINLPFYNRSNAAYRAAMYWVVENCDILIAVWNGKDSRKIGGTKDAVERAIFLNRSWIHINVAELCVAFHHSN